MRNALLMHVPGANPQPPERAAMTQRLREAVDHAGGPKVVSERSQVPLSTLNGYLAGGEPKVSNLLRVARACGASMDWLTAGSPPLPRWVRKDAVVMGLSAERQAPLHASGLDVHWLAKAIEIVDALGGTKLPVRERAARIAQSYELLTTPESDLPPLPQVPRRDR